jgi:hypothetical protein
MFSQLYRDYPTEITGKGGVGHNYNELTSKTQVIGRCL